MLGFALTEAVGLLALMMVLLLISFLFLKIRNLQKIYRKNLDFIKLLYLENYSKKTFNKFIKAEILQLKWAISFHLFSIQRIYKKYTDLLIYYYIKNKKKKNLQNTKNTGILMCTKTYAYVDSEKIIFGKSPIESAYIEKQIRKFVLFAITDSDIFITAYFGDYTALSNNHKKLANIAFDYYVSWNRFTKYIPATEDDLDEYKSMFPLNATEDFFFFKGILELEKKYGNKITTFICLLYLERIFDSYYGQEIYDLTCDLSFIFRHKDSLKWFITLLKVYKKKIIEFSYEPHFNIETMITNLSYIYDKLPKKRKNNNEIEFPIILATGTFFFTTLYGPSCYSLFAQSKLLMMEVLPLIKNSFITLENSRLLHLARLSDSYAFTNHLEPYIHSPTEDKTGEIKMFNQNLAQTYSKIFKHIRPKNPNTTIFSDLLLSDPGNTNRFSKELATVGVSLHFDDYNLYPVSKYKDKHNFEYAIEIDDTLIPIEIKSYGRNVDDIPHLIATFEAQRWKQANNYILIIDCSNKRLTNKQIDHINNMLFELQNNPNYAKYKDRIKFVNSTSLMHQINSDIWEFSKNSLHARNERNRYFFESLTVKERNKVSGKTTWTVEDAPYFEKLYDEFMADESKEII